MKNFTSIEDAETKVMSDVESVLSCLRKAIDTEIASANQGISVLRSLREEIYEDLNQIQHEHLLVEAVKWLKMNVSLPDDMTWEWNPRQTGTFDEPDLRGSLNGVVLISAEASASRRPVGIIDKRMGHTLAKLTEQQGMKYYFVRTPDMERRAKTKVNKKNWQISVQLLNSLEA